MGYRKINRDIWFDVWQKEVRLEYYNKLKREIEKDTAIRIIDLLRDTLKET